MYNTEVLIRLMQKKVRIGEEIKGLQIIRDISDKIGFNIKYKDLFNYSMDIANIYSFASADELYNDMILNFCPADTINKVKVNSFKNKSANIIDKMLEDFTISVEFLEYAFNDFLEELVYKILYELNHLKSDFSKVNISIDIPIECIDNIYMNYDIDIEEKIVKFMEEMTLWIMYNRISVIDEEAFDITKNNGEVFLILNMEIKQY